MFCKKCGKELNEEVKYCNFCGADVTNENKVSEKKNDFFEWIAAFFKPLGKGKKWLVATMLLLLLNPILSMCENFKYSENITGQSIYSETTSVFKDFLLMLAEEIPFVGFLIFIGIGTILFAEFYMVLPLIKKHKYKAKYLIPTQIISIIAFLFIMFLNIGNFIEAANNETVNYTLTFWGWLLDIDCILLLITSFKLSSTIKKEIKAEKELEKQ